MIKPALIDCKGTKNRRKNEIIKSLNSSSGINIHCSNHQVWHTKTQTCYLGHKHNAHIENDLKFN